MQTALSNGVGAMPAVLDNRYKAWLAGQLSPHTKRAYATDIAQFMRSVGKTDISAITRDDIYQFRLWLTENYKPASANRKLSSVRQLFAEAVAQGLITHNPTERIKGYKVDSTHSSTLSPSEEQVKALIASVSNSSEPLSTRDKAMIYVLAGMGLRRAEVCALKVSDIVTDNGKIALEVFGKGSKVRRIEIPDNVYNALKSWIQCAGATGDDTIFVNAGGEPLTPNGIYYIVERRMRSVGIEGCSPHSLRHFLITYLLSNGCGIYDAQRIAGHADPRTTERYDRRNSGACSSAKELVGF